MFYLFIQRNGSLKVPTTNYYGTDYKASSVRNQRNPIKFNELKFRLMRTATKDCCPEISRKALKERHKRAIPDEWVKFSTASRIGKTA